MPWPVLISATELGPRIALKFGICDCCAHAGGARGLKERISELMKSGQVPGLAIFTTRDGVEGIGAFGVRNIETGAPVDAHTVFESASLSKPAVAHAALQLVDAGQLDLDEPLSRFVGQLVPRDPASASITARHVLSHTTGLPNWRRNDVPLRTYSRSVPASAIRARDSYIFNLLSNGLPASVWISSCSGTSWLPLA